VTDSPPSTAPEAAPPEPQPAEVAPAAQPAGTPEEGGEVGVAEATPHDFGELAATPTGAGAGSLSMLFDLMMPVSVELGRTAMTVREVLELTRGSVVPLNRLAGEPIDIYVSDRKLAEGEVVVLGEHFGVRLTKVIQGGVVPGASPAEARSG